VSPSEHKNTQKKTRRRIIVLKVSGEAFGGGENPLDEKKISYLTSEIASVKGASIVIVPGGGNILRGESLKNRGYDKADSDYLGMLSTVYNSVCLKHALAKKGLRCRLFSALSIDKITIPYNPEAALTALRAGECVIVAGGTGNPFVTTDSAAALRALELGADILIKATKVNGVYSDDPIINKKAVFFKTLSYEEAVRKNPRVCDRTALTMLSNSNIKFMVLNIFKPGNIKKAAGGKCPGTLIS